MTKYIFVTGGVVSSVGKGISAASIARILKSAGLSVSVQKLDPYLNVDPGTMSPYQHGEVFVTRDGSETDMDLGHYERFTDLELTSSSSVTAGQVYSGVISNERAGEYLGGTIQTVPHVTNVIKQHMMRLAEESDPDVVVVEVGGTVGDIEGLPFLEAIRQMPNEVGHDNVYYIHVTLLPAHLVDGRAEDEADAAQREGAAEHRHPARLHHLPQRLSGAGGHQGQDRAVLRREAGGGDPPADGGHHL